ncbi:MAG: presenilin family intramembrane aspartyl protease PSH [Thermoplasmatota archaeon]
MAESAPTEQKGPLPVTMAEIRSTGILLSFFLAAMGLSVLFANPFHAAQLQVFQDPKAGTNILWYFLLILAFTLLILALAKWGPKWTIQAIILFAVGSTVAYVVYPLMAVTFGVEDATALAIAVVGAGAAVAALFWYPEWYVVDTVGLLVAGATAALFGISVAVNWVVVLLVALALYDAIAVYRTKHMLSLADAVIELRLPVLLVVPKHAGYRFRRESTKVRQASSANKGEREAMFMGLGDLVMPSILVVAALMQPGATTHWGPWPALGAAAGTVAGYVVLMSFVLKGNPQAGLPLLNGGAILGFLVALLAATHSLRFW